MRILVACEYSGRVRDAFIKRGHDAMSCDTLPTDVDGPHYQGDVMDILGDGWDLMVAHPPCTYLTNTSVCWLHAPDDHNPDRLKGRPRWDALESGAAFFKALLNSGIPRIAVENPIPHKYAVERIGAKYTQIVHPWQFGHMERKATCLWLKGLPALQETNNVYSEMIKLPKREQQRLHYLPPSQDRWKLRSTTYQGIADAMADQWG